jgi:hypothetical protein
MRTRLENGQVAFLTGVEVEQVCLGKYQIILNCSSDVSISVESSLRHLVADETASAEWNADGATGLPHIHRLLGSVISGISVQQDGSLLLRFSQGDTVLVGIRSDGLESFQITKPNVCVVV